MRGGFKVTKNGFERYSGRAVLPDGTEITVMGSLQAVANWADNVIRLSETSITINIERMEGEHG